MAPGTERVRGAYRVLKTLYSLFKRVNDSRGDGAFVYNARATHYKRAVLRALNMLDTSIKK